MEPYHGTLKVLKATGKSPEKPMEPSTWVFGACQPSSTDQELMHGLAPHTQTNVIFTCTSPFQGAATFNPYKTIQHEKLKIQIESHNANSLEILIQGV